MGNRLTRIYTRTGDDGSTGLGDGTRVAKDHLRVEAMGDVDELNSVLGLLLTDTLPDDTRALLVRIQHDLFDLGAELCIPGHRVIPERRAEELEQAIDHHNESLPPLKEFILPGGSRSAALCHLARAVCRRAERRLVSLHGHEPLAPAALRYLNRLSDLLFVMARRLNRHAGGLDVLWQSNYK
ncbi:MAG: cob(I)yrinic acid a,c-diamide adenosyltransferase [Betaproteobacteria bacterium]|nr:cob(I)yrinic acid a,c-diamide adenosyltransferase [Betaproteobacteria bacterium]MDE1981635.1 cob(I)yrinic acid a,c-diamide adenosyltransferase [Betaproteobacteria bacterium]MDE2211991.1 cob(I)yrinic acid a,c-diamide adenosyltransferase [Betaproteobacteria bacterium]